MAKQYFEYSYHRVPVVTIHVNVISDAEQSIVDTIQKSSDFKIIWSGYHRRDTKSKNAR